MIMLSYNVHSASVKTEYTIQKAHHTDTVRPGYQLVLTV